MTSWGVSASPSLVYTAASLSSTSTMENPEAEIEDVILTITTARRCIFPAFNPPQVSTLQVSSPQDSIELLIFRRDAYFLLKDP